MISIDELRRLLTYDPASGELRWQVWVNTCSTPGALAGHVRKNGYVAVVIKRQHLQAHRIAWALMTGSWPTMFIDHIDRNPSNNKWVNLRLADHSENQANSIRRTSLAKGVTRHSTGKFQAQIKLHGKSYYLGLHETEEAAHLAYMEKAKEFFGQFARAGQ